MKRCEVCGSPEHPSWKAHVFATNTPATNAGATNKAAVAQSGFPGDRAQVREEGIERRHSEPEVAGSNPASRATTANRRTRDAFNAYQRIYMQVRRAIEAGKASPWPR